MFVTVNGVRLFFDVLNPKLALDEAGALTTKPTMVCLHGGPGGDHQTMRPAFDVFAEAAQVVYLDQRGGGRSEHGPASGWTLDQWADDVRAFCDALGIERPIVLGQSGGAIVAQAYLARHPGHAAGAILVNPCSRMDRDVLIAGWTALGGTEAGEAARKMYTVGGPAEAAGFMRHCFRFYASRPADPARMAGFAARTSFNPDLMQRFFQEGGEAWRVDHRQALGQVDCPVLLLVGGKDPVTRPEWGREVADALPPGRAKLVLIEEASHMIPTDAPERFEGEIMGFLERLADASET